MSLLNFQTKGGALMEQCHQVLYGLYDECSRKMRSLGGFPIKIVEDLLDRISCKSWPTPL